MNKIKQILPSLKEKKRYLVFEVRSKGKINMETALKHIDNEVKRLLGEIGYGKAGVMFIDHNDNKAVLKANNKEIDDVRLALTLVKDINNEEVVIRTLGVSGILNKAKEKWF